MHKMHTLKIYVTYIQNEYILSVKRQSRQYFSYDEWRLRERLKQERLRAEQQYRLEERRRQRLQQEAYRRRQQRRPSAQIRSRPSAHIRRRRPQRQIEPGELSHVCFL